MTTRVLLAKRVIARDLGFRHEPLESALGTRTAQRPGNDFILSNLNSGI
jgi:hypothetical protein